jgi:hypothetical protein
MRLSEVLLHHRQIVRIERNAFSGMGAEEAGDARPRGPALLDGALEPKQIGFAQTVQRTAFIVAFDQLILGNRDHHRAARGDAAQQQSANLATLRSHRSETIDRLPLETIHQLVWNPYRNWLLRYFPEKKRRCGSLQIVSLCTRRRLIHRECLPRFQGRSPPVECAVPQFVWKFTCETVQ